MFQCHKKMLPKSRFFFDFKLKKLSTSKYKAIPGLSPSHSDLGNFPDIGKSGSLHEFLIDQHNKLGDIFTFYWLKQQVVSLGHPQYWNNISSLFDRPPELFVLFPPLIQKRVPNMLMEKKEKIVENDI